MLCCSREEATAFMSTSNVACVPFCIDPVTPPIDGFTIAHSICCTARNYYFLLCIAYTERSVMLLHHRCNKRGE